MPDASIVVKATDRYSEAMKKMASVTKSFSKDVDALEDTLYALNKNKITLKMDLSKAKSELKAAEKQFDLTHSAADGLKLELAQANYDSMVRNLKAVTSAARDTEKAISKVENQSKSQKATVTSVATAIAASGIGDMAKELALSFGTSVAGSLGGDNAGTMASSVLSSAATGAAMGSIIPGIGTALGAAIGAAVGGLSGGLQIYEKKDDAFKSYVEDAYETVTGEQSSSLTSGSSIAGSREQTRMAFAQRMGEEEADAYLERVKTMATSTNYSYDEITGYSKVVDIKYDNSGRHYTVELQTASQYLGDVTQYQEQIAELESAAAEKDSTITAQASTIQSQESQIESQTATIQEQATTIQELREAGTAAELETGLDAAYEEGVNSVE